MNRRQFTRLLCAAPLAGLLPAEGAPAPFRLYSVYFLGKLLRRNNWDLGVIDDNGATPGFLYHSVQLDIDCGTGVRVQVRDRHGAVVAVGGLPAGGRRLVWIGVPHRHGGYCIQFEAGHAARHVDTPPDWLLIRDPPEIRWAIYSSSTTRQARP